MTNISIIIPNFNGAKYLSECLKHLKLAIDNCPNTKFEIIIVDNGSIDNSLKLVKEHIIIKNSQNLGFATAVNQGINKAQFEYVCLLNNDVNLDKNYFKIIINNIKNNSKIACFCGTVLNYNGTEVESQGISFDWSGKCLQNRHRSSGLVWGASGAVVIYQKNILKKIGLFDQKYFAYIEDVDVAFRLQKNDYQTLLDIQAVAYHIGGATSNRMGNFRAKQVFKNWIYFIHKNYSFTQILLNSPQIFIERLRNLSYLLKSTINL